MLNLQRHWYARSLTWLTFLLLPLSYLFRLMVALRLFLYKQGLLKTIHFSVPVIIVGNLTVGGTGKTPFILWLARFLKSHQWRPGIVSRGVGGVAQTLPLWVDKQATPAKVGDEAVLLARQSDCPVVICVNRVAAVKELLANTDCNIILSDDGLQHYRLGRRIEIAIIDGDRQFGNGHLLPAGPLREAKRRLQQVNLIVQHGEKNEKNDSFMQLEGSNLVSLAVPEQSLPLAHFANTKLHAVAGIGNPQRFFSALRQQGLDIIEHVFPDHYRYEKEDFNFSDSLPIVMTEKDKVKCEAFADHRFWYYPVEAKVDKQCEDKLLILLKGEN